MFKDAQLNSFQLVKIYHTKRDCVSWDFPLEYRRERADMIQTYKILHGIDKIDKDKLFTPALYSATRGHSYKLQKGVQD